MENVRLIYEQIETAKAHLLRGGVLDCRLLLILLDNTAELLMARALRDEFDFEDFFHPRGLGGHPKPAIDGHLKTGHLRSAPRR